MKAKEIIKEFKKHGLGPYIEVPCSLLGPIIEGLARDPQCEVLNPANEAISMGIAAGSFLATGRVPVVLTQNSGLCNTINALTSLHQVYNMPVLYLIAWRGKPGTKDAPEHKVMGKKTENILKALDIPYKVLSEKSYKSDIRSVINKIKRSGKPSALLLRRGIVEKDRKQKTEDRRQRNAGISRESAIASIIDAAAGRACFISTNGYISREACHALSTRGIDRRSPCFYMLGSMGHALPIGIGVERYAGKRKKVIVLDGDGGCLMHMGAMASVGKGRSAAKNLIHVVLDNGVYASTGSQPTISHNADFAKIALGCGYRNALSVTRVPTLARVMTKIMRREGPSFVHVRINDRNEPAKSRVSDRYTCEEIRDIFSRKAC